MGPFYPTTKWEKTVVNPMTGEKMKVAEFLEKSLVGGKLVIIPGDLAEIGHVGDEIHEELLSP